MSELLYGRRARLALSIPAAGDFRSTVRDNLVVEGADAGDVPGLRISFKIVKTSGKEPNSSEVTVYNLAPPSRAALQSKGLKMRLEAGYQAVGITTLFLGDVRTVDHVRDGADWRTVIKAGDGERAFEYARVSESFSADSTLLQVVQAIAGKMGLTVGAMSDTAQQVLSVRLFAGWAVHGKASTELTKALGGVGLTWSTQDGQVQILAPGETIGASIPEIAPDSGLIGSPEMGSPEKKGGAAHMKFKCLLIPSLKPGVRVGLRSERYTGQYGVLKVTHSGDTAGGDWYSEIEASQQ